MSQSQTTVKTHKTWKVRPTKSSTVSVLASGLLTLVGLILFFALVYHYVEGWDVVHSLYTSTMIQTLVGLTDVPQNTKTKLIMAFQALLSFMIASSIISILWFVRGSAPTGIAK